MAQRETFGSRFSIIMAMAGSAIGLGNIWRFPYTVGEGGGAAFIIVYLVSTLLLTMPVFMAESIIGRTAQAGTFGAMQKLAPGSKWKWMGFLTVITPLIIVSYYSVVGGWSFGYLLKALTFSFNADAVDSIGGMFSRFTTSAWTPIVCHTVFLGSTCLIVLRGVKKGIEKFASITMPLLFVLILIIMVYSISLPGASAGLEYMLKPDFSKLDGKTIASAMGQSFFTLSLGTGSILTYASYVKKDENILISGLGTAGFDLLFAMIAGFAVMPAVFAAGIEPGAGPGLVFETLPYIFAKMGADAPWLSAAISILFFASILFAALTSSISMIEVGVAYLVEEKKMTRGRSVLLLFLGCWALGVICSLSFGPLAGITLLGKTIFEFCDSLTSDYLMAFGGLLFILFAGWKMSKATVREELTCFGKSKLNITLFPLLYFLIRYVAPFGIIAIFITNLIW